MQGAGVKDPAKGSRGCCVAPQAGNYLQNSPGSTVQGSELGEGRSPRSPSSCSSLSRLPEGRKDFTKTPPVTPGPASPPRSTLPAPPVPQGRAVLQTGRGLPKGHPDAAGRWQVPHKEDRLLGKGGVSLPDLRRRKVREGLWCPWLPVPLQPQPKLTTTPSKFFSQLFPGTLAHPKPMEYNKILFL